MDKLIKTSRLEINFNTYAVLISEIIQFYLEKYKKDKDAHIKIEKKL